MRQLTLLRDGKKVAEYLLDTRDTIVGRGRSANIRLDDNSLVSRQHCVVRERGGPEQHDVEDLGGANGTFVNGVRVEIHTLRPGDRIVFGEDTLRYDLATASASSMRVPVQDTTDEDADTIGDDEAPFEELGWEAVSVVDDMGAIREAKRLAAETMDITEDRGERTTVASKEELNRLIAEVAIKAKPHLLVHSADPPELLPLTETVVVGHSDECTIRLPGWKLFGKVAASLVRQTGAWNVVPESTFWNPVWIGDDKVERIRALDDGDRLEFKGLVVEYRKGDDR